MISLRVFMSWARATGAGTSCASLSPFAPAPRRSSDSAARAVSSRPVRRTYPGAAGNPRSLPVGLGAASVAPLFRGAG